MNDKYILILQINKNVLSFRILNKKYQNKWIFFNKKKTYIFTLDTMKEFDELNEKCLKLFSRESILNSKNFFYNLLQ